MATKKTPAEIKLLTKGGSILARILRELAATLKPGMSTEDINDLALELAEKYGVEPVLLGYHPTFADHPYPGALCVSVNDTVQHGVPRADEILAEGDIVNLDMSIGYEGMIVDSGITVGVGAIDAESQKLIDVTREALVLGIKQAQPGNRIGDISHAIQTYVEAHGFSIVEELCGHGVGYAVHEDPQIPNYGKAGKGPKIEVGHVYAIEPIVNIGKKDVIFDDDGDGYSVFTTDGSRAAHFEHTVAITEKGPVIMTKE
ncbi:type I methionyl aminopeptidase [Candidatus Parcubacteria bacterium]|uniref:Methionine aminopeptidase n=1 Tax=Candidatus Kaiserbacteria bacterium CG10_big_fil_rev_8_21_14_0_10_47_16 TaxID=1974608 RepID=A0A2H0UDW7_9BACT|nr:type I methionyl aminopeptidase [Candidatus Parcubacteria bacterium]PIR84592.1 MAG: type I methionyl aminopeptidase [Candidatus Kaiserbacteria bacterium CG10_big_fil_rev_8_21_14_0_10_47_16]